MANKDKVLAALRTASGFICDDCLTKRAMLKQRQIAHSICTQFFRGGMIERVQNTCVYCRGYKFVNRLPQIDTTEEIVQADVVASPEGSIDQARQWFWEGNVQASLVAWLSANGYSIRAVADTAAKSAGKDIVAVDRDGREWWISVKGYPIGTERTNPSTQARHWFAKAMFDLVLYRDEKKEVVLAAAFPDGFTTYHNLAARITWLKEVTPFSLFWIAADGQVRRE